MIKFNTIANPSFFQVNFSLAAEAMVNFSPLLRSRQTFRVWPCVLYCFPTWKTPPDQPIY